MPKSCENHKTLPEQVPEQGRSFLVLGKSNRQTLDLNSPLRLTTHQARRKVSLHGLETPEINEEVPVDE